MSERELLPETQRLRRKLELIDERGGLPWAPGEPARPISVRLRAIRWELAQFMSLIEYDDMVAGWVVDGAFPFHKATMSMRHHCGYYEDEDGEILHEIDVEVQRRIDPGEEVSG